MFGVAVAEFTALYLAIHTETQNAIMKQNILRVRSAILSDTDIINAPNPKF
jgi:hypothetical protein